MTKNIQDARRTIQFCIEEVLIAQYSEKNSMLDIPMLRTSLEIALFKQSNLWAIKKYIECLETIEYREGKKHENN